jgi:hypothetical protein
MAPAAASNVAAATDDEEQSMRAILVGILLEETPEVPGALFRQQFETRFGVPFPNGKLRDLLLPLTLNGASPDGSVCALEFRASPAADAPPLLFVVAPRRAAGAAVVGASVMKEGPKLKKLCKFGPKCRFLAAGTCSFLHPPAL